MHVAYWCLADGTYIHQTFPNWGEAYDWYCHNPLGLTEEQLYKAQHRGVVNLARWNRLQIDEQLSVAG